MIHQQRQTRHISSLIAHSQTANEGHILVRYRWNRCRQGILAAQSTVQDVLHAGKQTSVAFLVQCLTGMGCALGHMENGEAILHVNAQLQFARELPLKTTC